jgi:signal transduction histidine kinase/CheY-like chemotaxis protein
MKKSAYYFLSIILVIFLLNIVLNVSIYRKQIVVQRHILSGQAGSAANAIETTVMDFENDVNALLYAGILSDLDFARDDNTQEGIRSLEMLFSNYRYLINNLNIYDTSKNVLNLSFNKRNNLLTDPFIMQQQNEIHEKITLETRDNEYLYTFPVFRHSRLYANLVFTINIPSYFNSVFRPYYHDQVFCQWVVNTEGLVLYTNAPKNTVFKDLSGLRESILKEQNSFSTQDVVIDHKEDRYLSASAPALVFGDKLGIVFSMRKSYVLNLIFFRMVLSGILSTLILLLFIILVVKRPSVSKKKNINPSNLQPIFDNLPVGIILLDQQQHSCIVNQAARDMLFIPADENVSGKSFSDRFMLSRDYYDSGTESAFDSSQFVLYRHEGEEVAVYKKDLAFMIGEEEYTISVFADVTPIEKARKYEAAANTAKSEFLAKMSHEIRTPMNGIIGMTDAINQENLNAEQKEYIQIVKRSADLLLNLIDDILDFSKIEAGKMQLEEIPFRLRDEVKLAIDLFRPIVEEKSVTLHLRIKPEVPENIIGDPFRLRQVLTNLISNAVKFTHEGEIVIGVELEEEYNNNLTIQFVVEDTGVGIPRSKIETIFNSFTQAEESTSRKYGGSGLGTTIAKQLVNLMHGEISVESPSSISTNPAYPGSRFSFTIEVYSNERTPKVLPVDKFRQFSQIQALVITRFPQTKQRLFRLFEREKMKYEIFEFTDENRDLLIDKLKHNPEYYHTLFILDEQGLNGLSLSQKLKEAGLTDLFIIFTISANHKSENFVQSRSHGVDFYIIEPFEQEDVIHYMYDAFPALAKSHVEVVRKFRTDLSILVAEDNEINIRVAQSIFSNIGFKIDIAKNGNEVIEKVNSREYDIVFMDLVMPERDGIQATVEIRGQGYQMPIIAMTATASSKSKLKALSSGMNDYIVKPVKTDSIRAILLKWFA